MSGAAVRKDQVQNVLEHEPVKEAACEKHVCIVVPLCYMAVIDMTGSLQAP